MLKSPALYSVSADYQDDDPGLVQKRADIIHSAAAILEKCNLIKYERASGRFQSTELGRIASHYYVTHNSMSVYNQHLRTDHVAAGTVPRVRAVERVQADSRSPRGK
jgi:pre-mRNA-splicing helicase BRR2